MKKGGNNILTLEQFKDNHYGKRGLELSIKF